MVRVAACCLERREEAADGAGGAGRERECARGVRGEMLRRLEEQTNREGREAEALGLNLLPQAWTEPRKNKARFAGMSRTCLGHVSDMSRTCLGHVSEGAWTCPL